MNQKLYSLLRLLLGLFILLGIGDTGNIVVNNYRRTFKTITTHTVVALQKQQKPLQLVMFYCSKLIDSTKTHLS